MALFLGAIDDDREILYTLEAMALSQGWKIVVTTEPNEVLEWIRQGRIDILLLDYHMPQMTGLELVREVREISGDVGIIVLTIEEDIKVAREMMLAGADDFVTKPVRLADFSARVRLHSELSSYRKAGRRKRPGKGITEETLRRVLSVIRKSDIPLNASSVAKITGLAYPTVHRYLEELVRIGRLVRTHSHSDGRSGRPMSLYYLKE